MLTDAAANVGNHGENYAGVLLGCYWDCCWETWRKLCGGATGMLQGPLGIIWDTSTGFLKRSSQDGLPRMHLAFGAPSRETARGRPNERMEGQS